MKISTIRIDGATRAVRQDGDTYTEINGFADVGTLLQDPQWQEKARNASGTQHEVHGASLAAVVPNPGKIICVGANYLKHIQEMGSEVPQYPTLFAKYSESLIGANDIIELPAEDAAVDWEAELAIIIGKAGRRISEASAADHIAGYSVLNDVSMRSYQFRSMQWLQGKTWENSTPFGPALVTADELNPHAAIRTKLNGETVQDGSIDDLVFKPAQLIAYISTILTLKPGDVIATGTPSGVGHARKPQQYITDGAVLETSIEGLGTLRNRAAASKHNSI